MREPRGIPTGGQFAEHVRSDATVQLATAALADVVIERWQGGEPIEVSRARLDVRSVLDSLSVEQIEYALLDSAGADAIYADTGHLPELPEGGTYTFDLDTPEVADYLRARRSSVASTEEV